MNTKLPDRQKALLLGIKQYLSGTPCKNGNIAPRLVLNSACCCDLCKRERVEKTKKWRNENPDKSKLHWRSRNPEHYKISQKKHYEANKYQINQKTREYALLNREKVLKRKKQYYAENPDMFFALSRARKASQKNARPPWFGELDRLVDIEASHLALLRKLATGFEWHVDHMYPLRAKTVSGLHCSANLQVIPAYLNLRKHNRLVLTNPFEWIMVA